MTTRSLSLKVITTALIAVVLLIVAVLMSPRIGEGFRAGALVSTKTQMDAYQAALQLYVLDCGAPPTPSQGLSVLVTNPGVARWKGPYLDPPLIRFNAWGTPFRYRVEGTNMIVKSAGPDTRFGTADDLQGIGAVR